MSIDLNREAERVRAEGAKLAGEGWLSDSASPSQVAAYVAASERAESLSTGDVVEIVRQGLDVDVAADNTSAVRGLARDVLLKRAQG
jgi:hypothetical protein